MDEGTEDTIENYDIEPAEIDEDYEFDAARFFDFTRPEFESEIEAAESWFEVSGDYNPSPFIVKLNLEKLFAPNHVKGSLNTKSSSRHEVSASKKNFEGKRTQMLTDSEKSETRLDYQPRSSTLMKPTASHLAKQNKLQDVQYKCCTSSYRSSNNLSEKSSQSGIGLDIPSTKRQKLEIGYLRKIAHLKHHTSFLHKSSKKVTIPREPELETLLRAQRRSSKNSTASNENDKENQRECNFKALPLNKKILQAPSLMQPRKYTHQLTQIQMFRLMTTERANLHASAKASNAKNADPCVSNGGTDSKRPNTRETLNPRKSQLDSKACILSEKVNDQESESSYGDMILEALPIEQFNELSLGREIEDDDVAPLKTDVSKKGLTENAENDPDSCQSAFWRSLMKPNQCGDHLRVLESESLRSMNKAWTFTETRTSNEAMFLG